MTMILNIRINKLHNQFILLDIINKDVSVKLISKYIS